MSVPTSSVHEHVDRAFIAPDSDKQDTAPADAFLRLTRDVSALSRQVEAQELMLAVVARALHPMVDRKQIAHARRVIVEEMPPMKPQGDPDLKTAVLAVLDRFDSYLNIPEDADDVER